MGTVQQVQRIGSFETHPDRYRHWKLEIGGPVATLTLDIDEANALRPGDYTLKLNSYDLGVDIELQDAADRLRFEHPEVRAVLVTSGMPRVFSAGANIKMLASSTHGFKVNFCKYTNETRAHIEEASRHAGQTWIAGLNGTASGGGYELALACDEIYLIDDGSSAASLPEVPLLGVLPGTGGLTRLVDKRKVRRDIADVFCTKAEGFRARDAVKYRIVDGSFPRSKWEDGLREVLATAAARNPARAGHGIAWIPIEVSEEGLTRTYSSVMLSIDEAQRVAHLTVHAPTEPAPADGEALLQQGAATWSLRAWRELEDALLHLRFNHDTIGVILLHTAGDPQAVLAHDQALLDHQGTWIADEIRHFQGRVLRRLDNTARSVFALIDEGSCFAGPLFELALAADRSYMLEDEDGAVTVQLTAASDGALPMSTGLSRLQTRYQGEPERVGEVLGLGEPIDAPTAFDLGLVTMAPDDIDWEDEVRIAVEERASLSPDALTGMEQNLRFVGAENCDTKIFGRLSAWQNWIFQRPNAVGETGALTLYGHPERPQFDWRRT
jgi:benzoyl-CoA-dihydrodiol lyase